MITLTLMNCIQNDTGHNISALDDEIQGQFSIVEVKLTDRRLDLNSEKLNNIIYIRVIEKNG